MRAVAAAVTGVDGRGRLTEGAETDRGEVADGTEIKRKKTRIKKNTEKEEKKA